MSQHIQKKINTIQQKQTIVHQRIQQIRGGYGADIASNISQFYEDMRVYWGKFEPFLQKLIQQHFISDDQYNYQKQYAQTIVDGFDKNIHPELWSDKGKFVGDPRQSLQILPALVMGPFYVIVSGMQRNTPRFLQLYQDDVIKVLGVGFDFYVKFAMLWKYVTRMNPAAMGPMIQMIKLLPEKLRDGTMKKYMNVTKEYIDAWDIPDQIKYGYKQQ